MRSIDSPTVYDREFYTSVENVVGLLRLGFMMGSLVFGVFVVFLGLGAGQGDFQITSEMLLFYGILSYGGGFGALIAFFCLEHPNAWVRRGFFVVMFLIPLVMMLL